MKGPDPHLKLSVTRWMEIYHLTKYDLLSLTFTPGFTFDDLIRGTRLLPAMYRVYLLTGLEVFKLTDEEKREYEKSKETRPQSVNDEKIARHFIELWKAKGILPEGDERLVLKDRNNPDKKKVTEILLARYFDEKQSKQQPPLKKQPSIPEPEPPKVQKQLLETPAKAIQFEITSFVSVAGDELENVLNLTLDEIKMYQKRNATGLKRLKILIEHFMKGNPKASYEEMLTSTSFFNFLN